MPERPNFYLLLELDPATDDWPAIEQRLIEKKRAWSKDKIQGNPRARRRAESSLAQVQKIEAVLKDPGRRRQEAREARRQQDQARRERMRELDEAISLLKTGPPCSDDQWKQLGPRFAAALAPAQIKRRLQPAGVPLAEARTERKPRSRREQIPAVTAQNVRQNLDHLGLATLYDFLGLKPQSSPKALCDHAEEIYKENLRLGNTDADTSARNELAGICKSVCQREAEKARYDAYLAVAAMESLKPNLELAGGDGFLTREKLDALVKIARQRGVAAADARAFIEDYAAGRKWGVQRGAGGVPSAAGALGRSLLGGGA